MRIFLCPSVPLQGRQNGQRFVAVGAADQRLGLKPGTNPGPIGRMKNAALQIRRKVNAGHSGRFAIGHTRDGRRNTDGNAASSTMGSTFHIRGIKVLQNYNSFVIFSPPNQFL